MNDISLRQKALGCLVLLLLLVLAMAVTAVAANGIAGTVAGASVRIRESADSRVIQLGQQETLQRAIAALDNANGRMADVAGQALDVAAATGQRRDDSGAWFWWLCLVVIVLLIGATVWRQRDV